MQYALHLRLITLTFYFISFKWNQSTPAIMSNQRLYEKKRSKQLIICKTYVRANSVNHKLKLTKL